MESLEVELECALLLQFGQDRTSDDHGYNEEDRVDAEQGPRGGERRLQHVLRRRHSLTTDRTARAATTCDEWNRHYAHTPSTALSTHTFTQPFGQRP